MQAENSRPSAMSTGENVERKLTMASSMRSAASKSKGSVRFQGLDLEDDPSVRPGEDASGHLGSKKGGSGRRGQRLQADQFFSGGQSHSLQGHGTGS